jgi:hypothetical protein
VFLVIVQTISLFSQEGKIVKDTLLIQKDSVMIDTILGKPKKASSNAITEKVTYSAGGYIKREIINKKVILVSAAKVNYGEIEIKADSINFDMRTNLLFAIGRRDTTGKVIGKPVFKEGTQEFEADELTYNFKTRKALIKNIITKQESGLLHSAFTKLLEDGTSNISRSTYSTCDADTPHFYINLPKAKVYPGKKIISGPGNLVVEGIPLPLFLPFAYIPVQTKKAASGILIPRIGQENLRGYSLTDGGYYFAINDYFDLAVKGNLYANGTWMTTLQTDYRRLYKYNGNLIFSYANNVLGHKGLPDYNVSSNYRLGWNYNQDAKASPGSRFSASVNMSSSGYDRNNSYAVVDHVTTQRQSSVSYSKSWDNSPFNLSVSANHYQDVKTKKIMLDLPKGNFNMGRIYPLKSKNSSGPTKWYQDLQFSYSAAFDNQINTYDSLLFTHEIWKNLRNGFKHEAPLSLQLRPFNNFSISPSVTYTGMLYSQKIEKRWVPNYRNPATDQIVPSVVNDTIRGAFYGQAFNPSISASFNPQIFGTYQFTNPNSRIQAVRHVIRPSISFSYVPSLKGLSSKMYRQVQIDTTGTKFLNYSIYDGSIFGTPSLASKSGNISLSLVNIVEAKVFARNDTTGKPGKVKIIDNFGISTSYNIFADSMKWAPVSMQFRTTLAKNINISASSNFSLYGVDKNGQSINTFSYTQNKKLMRLNTFNASVDFSLSELLKGNKEKKNTTAAAPAQNALAQGFSGNNEMQTGAMSQPNTGAGALDAYGYPVFDVPWTMNISYSMQYSRYGLKSTITQGLILSGNISITKKMSMTYSSGYDFKGKVITPTQIGISRDLHCWEMNVNWVPNGTMKMWNFTIRVKASVLGDLKYERRKDFHDAY